MKKKKRRGLTYAAVTLLVITLPIVVVLGMGMGVGIAAAEVVRINNKKGGEGLTIALVITHPLL